MSYLASDLLPCLSVLSLVSISPIGLSVLVTISNTGQTVALLDLAQKRACQLGLPPVQNLKLSEWQLKWKLIKLENQLSNQATWTKINRDQ